MANDEPVFSALITAAGIGKRFGDMLPKQFTLLSGRMLLDWTIQAFLSHPRITHIYVALHPDHAGRVTELPQDARIRYIFAGGAARQDTVRQALDQIAATPRPPDFILIHDAARPCLSADLITRLCAALETSDTAIPALPVVDTVKRAAEDGLFVADREGLYTIQTPQGFRFSLIRELHRKNSDASLTDDSALYPSAKLIAGERANIKVTYAEDLSFAENFLQAQRGDIRTGTGFDVHKFNDAPGLLKMGGIAIAHYKTLDGHSDADVLLHAITDAVLGAIAGGDIGRHFSPADPRWKNADSAQFLQHAAGLVRDKDGIIAHIDATVICEAPKIAPHAAAMQARIAGILGLSPDRVSIKATTTEKLGFTGRGEGIAAQAVATIRLPFTFARIPHKDAK